MTQPSELVLLELRQVNKTLDEHSRILSEVSRESVRTAETTKNIWHSTERQEDHLSKLNDRTSKNTTAIAIVNEKTKTSKKAMAGYGGGGLLVLAITILQILQMLG